MSGEESCLSLPGERIKIIRPMDIVVSYQTVKGHERSTSFKGLEARCIQHEIDHLSGKLINA